MITMSREPNDVFLFSRRVQQIIVDIAAIAFIFTLFLIVYLIITPKIEYYTCDMSNLSYPYLSESIPLWAVALYGFLGPLLVVSLVEVYNSQIIFENYFFERNGARLELFSVRLRRLFVNLYNVMALFFYGLVSCLLLTEIGKKWIGRLRPHFLAVCLPQNNFNCISNQNTGSIYNAIDTSGDFCTGDPTLIREARQSFPSGHASFSVYTMLFTIVYLEARSATLRLRYFKALVQTAAFIALFTTCMSRVADYWHHPGDVIAGAILGGTIALFVTLVLGEFLWDYNAPVLYTDFDRDPMRVRNPINYLP